MPSGLSNRLASEDVPGIPLKLSWTPLFSLLKRGLQATGDHTPMHTTQTCLSY